MPRGRGFAVKIPGLVFLPVEHNVARAYMAAMRDLGLEPERTILLECEDTPRRASSPRESWRQRAFDLAYEVREELRARGFAGAARFLRDRAARKRTARLTIRRECVFAELVERLTRHAKTTGLPVEDTGVAVRDLLVRYGWPYETRRVRSLNDEDFVGYLGRECGGGFALYVGGGILRKPVLSAGVRFIHIHPGVVPDVRGSHCLLWSTLVRGCPGFSCFFMNEGIDTGDVVATQEYALVPAPIPGRFLGPEFADLRAGALINGLDPWYRGDLLRRVLREEPQPSRWQSRKQTAGSGKVYYFPHLLVRDKAVNRLLRAA